MPQCCDVKLRRIYDDAAPGDTGYRVLVDRLWPRGITKTDAALDDWLKDVAPSTELRRWYSHDVQRFAEFARRYRAELQHAPASHALDRLLQLARTAPVTLLTTTRDVEHSGAQVLQDRITTHESRSHRPPGASAHGTARSASGRGRRVTSRASQGDQK